MVRERSRVQVPTRAWPKALQEVIAGRIYYQGTHSVVVAKSGFTKKANELANTAKVILISEIDLKI